MEGCRELLQLASPSLKWQSFPSIDINKIVQRQYRKIDHPDRLKTCFIVSDYRYIYDQIFMLLQIMTHQM